MGSKENQSPTEPLQGSGPMKAPHSPMPPQASRETDSHLLTLSLSFLFCVLDAVEEGSLQEEGGVGRKVCESCSIGVPGDTRCICHRAWSHMACRAPDLVPKLFPL